MAAAALCEVLFTIEAEFGVADDDPRLVSVMRAVDLAVRAAKA